MMIFTEKIFNITIFARVETAARDMLHCNWPPQHRDPMRARPTNTLDHVIQMCS
jgi:hypothetical protein